MENEFTHKELLNKNKLLEKKILELQQEQQTLLESAEKYKNLIDNAPVGIILLDLKGVITFANSTLLNTLGYAKEELFYKDFRSINMGKKHREYQEIFDNMLKGKSNSKFELELINKISNHTTTFELQPLPVKENNKLSGIQIIVRNIEEREKYEELINYRLTYEQLTADIASHFLTLDYTEIDKGITDALKSIAEFTGATIVSVFEYNMSSKSFLITHEWCKHLADKQKHLLQDILDEIFIYFEKKLKKNEPIVITSPNDLSSDAFDEKKWMGKYQFRPMIITPILSSKKCFHGIVGVLGEANTTLKWPFETIPLLQLFGKLITTVLERKKTEDALRQNKDKLRNIFESSPDAIIVYDFKGNIIEFNHAAVDLHGHLSKNDFSKTNCFNLISPKHKKRAQKGTRYILKRGYLRNQELSLLKKDGSNFLAEVSTNLLRDIDNNPSAYVSIIKDISKRKKIEKDLKITQHSIDNASFPIFWVKPDASFAYVNKAACDSLGYTKNELLSMAVHDIDPYFSKSKWKNHWKRQREEKSFIIEAFHKHKNGVEIPVEITINHFIYEGEEFSFAFIQNISERKEYEKKLESAKEKAEESDKLKSAFLSNMSHEIRTPMNAILGFSKLLTQPNLTKEKKENFVNIINNSSNSLLRLIDDIIDISKIEAEQIQVDKSDCSINSMLDELYILYNSKAQNKKLTLIVKKGAGNEDVTIVTDRQRFNQIFSNLLDNSIKFTDIGFVEFGYYIKEDNKIIFYVKDTGIGIPKNMQRVIFDRFRQADNSNTRKYGGTGLGLTISKKLINLLGGELWMESSIAKGATFYFYLPSGQIKSKTVNQEENIKEDKKSYDWEGKTILIAEDVEYNFEFLKAILENTKVNIIWAKNGIEAVELFKSTPGINLILMDIRMPEMNGYKATRIIKGINKHIPVISQTAYAVEGEREKSFNAGCDDYIAKPIREKTLLEIIEKHIYSFK